MEQVVIGLPLKAARQYWSEVTETKQPEASDKRLRVSRESFVSPLSSSSSLPSFPGVQGKEGRG